jgi:hypothetical protein
VIVSPLRARVLVAWGAVSAISQLSTHNSTFDDAYFCISKFRTLFENPTRRYGVATTTATWNTQSDGSIGNTPARFLIASPPLSRVLKRCSRQTQAWRQDTVRKTAENGAIVSPSAQGLVQSSSQAYGYIHSTQALAWVTSL